MTEAERQQVIDALEEGLSFCGIVESNMAAPGAASEEYALIKAALAIMRREREPVACEHMWMPNGCCFHCGKYKD